MVSILITGDFCPTFRLKNIINNGSSMPLLENIFPYIKSSDFSIVNFETTIADDRDGGIYKKGPHLCCSEKAVEIISDAGFSMVTLANNHFYDYGEKGIENSFNAFSKYNIEYVGAGKSLEEAIKVKYVSVSNKTIAFINACEHEFSVATSTHGGCCPLDPIIQWNQIQEACDKADYVIVIIHGGHEHFQLPSLRMKQLYRFLIDSGADAVINHHQHCFSGYEIYKNCPIFYGIGNFCFDSPKPPSEEWHKGYMVQLDLSDKISFELIPYTQCKDEVAVIPLNDSEKEVFLKKIVQLNNIISDDNLLSIQLDKWMKESESTYYVALSPYQNRWLKGACRRGWIPAFLPKDKLLALTNYIDCESHRDRLLYMLKRKIKNI